jgi:antitoxin CcdA
MHRKQTVELTLDSDLVAAAEAAGIDLSALLEKALRESNSRERATRWREENREAIAASNAELATNGLWFRPAWLNQ